MATTGWITYEPKCLKLKSARSCLVKFAAEIAKLPVKIEIDRTKSIELMKRQAVANRMVDANARSHGLIASLHMLADLLKQGWSVRIHESQIQIRRPEILQDPDSIRQFARSQLHTERDEQLRGKAVRLFIGSMETKSLHEGQFVSIFSLMCDGRELANQLEQNCLEGELSDRLAAITSVVQPYIQVVNDEERCEHTGFRLRDIWRYFRHTWSMSYKSVPGREMAILVRDAAAPKHPVIGIAALSSAVAGHSIRDADIGWTHEELIRTIETKPSLKIARWAIDIVNTSIDEIYKDDLFSESGDPLITPGELTKPSDKTIKRLIEDSVQKRKEHYRFMESGKYKDSSDPKLASDDDWERQACTPLFRSKRTHQLADLLQIRRELCKHMGETPSVSGLKQLVHDRSGRRAISRLVRKAKADRVGICLADLSVCGAVPPYSELLGGKLVALLMMSPEIIVHYRKRYQNTPSIIASSMAGRRIVRSTQLAYISTSALYPVRPNQYDRLSIPVSYCDGHRAGRLKYRHLGQTKGQGSFHFGEKTVEELSKLLTQSKNGQRVNSIFGEGTNPRIRKIRDGMDQLGVPVEELITHGTPRHIYGVKLANNTEQFLLGIDKRPRFTLSMKHAAATTQQIVKWWTERWLVRRLERTEVLRNIRKHSLVHPIKHGARVPIPIGPIDQAMLFEDT